MTFRYFSCYTQVVKLSAFECGDVKFIEFPWALLAGGMGEEKWDGNIKPTTAALRAMFSRGKFSFFRAGCDIDFVT